VCLCVCVCVCVCVCIHTYIIYIPLLYVSCVHLMQAPKTKLKGSQIESGVGNKDALGSVYILDVYIYTHTYT
jgi:hypothetical protein